MKRCSTLLAILAAGLLLAGPALARGPWIHVRVDDGDGDNVDINLPLSAAELVLELVDVDAEARGEIDVDGRKMSVAELRQIWNAVKAAGDSEIIRLEEEGRKVAIGRKGPNLLVRVTERAGRGNVRIEVPVSVVDALFSGEEDVLDFRAAVAEMKHAGPGDVLTVKDGDSHIRVWID